MAVNPHVPSGADAGPGYSTAPDAGPAPDVINPEVLPPEHRMHRSGGGMTLHLPTLMRCPSSWFLLGVAAMGIFVYFTGKDRR